MITREKKGKSLIQFPEKYVVVDIETTGFSPEYDSIIEISGIKVENNEIVDRFNSLVKPPIEKIDLDTFIEELTGITNKELSTANEIQDVLMKFNEFIGNNILIGHNVSFDINFLYDNFLEYLDLYLDNDFIDTYRIFRKLYPNNNSHKLVDLCNVYRISNYKSHRAFSDSEATYLAYNNLKDEIKDVYVDYEEFKNLFIRKDNRKRKRFNLNDLTFDESKIDKENYFYGKKCVFTGGLTRYVRKDAAQIVKNIGGSPQNNVTKKTDVLIIADKDYISKNKSNSRKKAEKLYLEGQDIKIISETTFYSLINE